MEIPTVTLEAPRSKAKIEIREWITGGDREYVDEPLKNVEVKPQMAGKHMDMQISKMDPGAMMRESTHREFEKFVVSVDGSKEGIVAAILALPEEDTAFIEAAIQERGPKKNTQTSSM